MYRREVAKENIARHVHRQLPNVLLLNYKDPKLCDSGQFTSYRQALSWIKEKQFCLRRFINTLKLYPSLIQENACEPFWNFIQPLLPRSTEKSSSPILDGNLTAGFSPTPPSASHVSLPHDQSSITTLTNLPTVNYATEVWSNTLSDWKKESSPTRKVSLLQQPTLNKTLSLHGKGIVNIPSIFVSNESSMKESMDNRPGSNVHSSKVFLCKDPVDIEDSMSMAVLSSLSSVSFVHCVPPTVQPVGSIIPECDAFIFIMNNFTISASNCLSQLQQAQSLHLPIQFIRYHDFQLPQNLKEIVKISLASATDLDQYLSIRRRSYVTSSTSSVRTSCTSSDREASPERSCSSLFYRDQHKNLLSCLPLPPARHSEDRNSNSADRIVSTIVSCLKDGYQKAQLYDSNCHISCVSQIIDSVSKLLVSPLSYNTAYFQLKKKKRSKSMIYQHSLCSKPAAPNVWFQCPSEPSKRISSNGSQFKKSKKPVPKASTSNRKDHKNTNNLIHVIPAHRSESKTSHSFRRHRQMLFDRASSQISPDSSDSHSPTDPIDLTIIKTKHFEDSDNDHEDDDEADDDEGEEEDDEEEEEEEEEKGLEFPQLLDSSPDKCLSEEKETSYVVYPDCRSAFNKKPVVIKWPMPWNQMEKVKRQDSLRDETDSISTNFFDVDLTKELHIFSDED